MSFEIHGNDFSLRVSNCIDGHGDQPSNEKSSTHAAAFINSLQSLPAGSRLAASKIINESDVDHKN